MRYIKTYESLLNRNLDRNKKSYSEEDIKRFNKGIELVEKLRIFLSVLNAEVKVEYGINDHTDPEEYKKEEDRTRKKKDWLGVTLLSAITLDKYVQFIHVNYHSSPVNYFRKDLVGTINIILFADELTYSSNEIEKRVPNSIFQFLRELFTRYAKHSRIGGTYFEHFTPYENMDKVINELTLEQAELLYNTEKYNL